MTRRKNSMTVRDQITSAASDAAVASAATKYGMAGGTLTSIFGWLSSNGAAVLIGIVVTVAGFIVNYYFQRKRYRMDKAIADAREAREQELHAARLAAIKAGCAR